MRTWEILRFPCKYRRESVILQPLLVYEKTARRTSRTQTGYCRAKETKRGETDRRKSERLIVPMKSVNPNPMGNRWREAYRRNIGSFAGNPLEASNSKSRSTRRERIALQRYVLRRVREMVWKVSRSNQCFEEPSAVVPHARICGSSG